MAVPCGDHAECVSGAREGGALPPVPPKPPTPKPPTPPPARPRPVTLAAPSAAHLAFHEDNVGAISHFGMQARPASPFFRVLLCAALTLNATGPSRVSLSLR